VSYLNESHTGRSYLSSGYVTRGTWIPPDPGIYRNSGYLSTGYLSESYLNAVPAAIRFDEAGLAAELTVSGFAGGIPWNEGGTRASVGVTGFYAGAGADPGGILDNDIQTGGPLSYNVLTTPDRGTLTTYFGGAFTWNPSGATPGFYEWTYELYADGVLQDIGTVTIEYADVYASVGVQGFAGTLTAGAGFTGQGIRASVFPTGFGGSITLTVDVQGTAADVIKRAQVRADRYVYSSSELAGHVFLILPIHDEIVFEWSRKKLRVMNKHLRRIRKLVTDFGSVSSVPFSVDVEIATMHWAEKSEVDLDAEKEIHRYKNRGVQTTRGRRRRRKRHAIHS